MSVGDTAHADTLVADARGDDSQVIHADWLLVLLCVGAVTRLTRMLTDDVIGQPLRRFVIKHRPAPPALTEGDLPDKDQPADEDWLVYLVHCRWCSSIWISAAVTPVVWLWPDRWFIQIPLIALTASLAAGLSGRLE